MDEMKHKPGVIKPEDEFPEPERFPGLESIITRGFGTTHYHPLPPWERVEFLERHFELLDWWKWWRSFAGPAPGLRYDTDPRLVDVYRLSDKPIIVCIVWKTKRTEWDTKYMSQDFYRLIRRLWWRKIEPMKDAKLRAILEGAVALDALAGREP